MRRPPNLGARLTELAARYGRAHLASDPVQIPHRYARAADQEVAAFIAAALAYGSVKLILGSVERALGALDPDGVGPADALDALDPRACRERLGRFRHRFNDASDVAALFAALREMRRRSGSIEAFFDESAPRAAPLRDRLSAFTRRALAIAPPADGVAFFFADPADGSACKRLCMFLRWVVRPADGVDLGLWSCLAPGDLVMPLDTHTSRIAFWNGLSPSPYATWRNAERVTSALRRYDRNDPVRFDFALSRLGILRVPPGPAASVRLRARTAR